MVLTMLPLILCLIKREPYSPQPAYLRTLLATLTYLMKGQFFHHQKIFLISSTLKLDNWNNYELPDARLNSGHRESRMRQ